MKAKVPLYRTNPTRAVLIDTEATPGATVGVNLRNPDGSLYVPPSAGGAAPGTGIALDDVEVTGTTPIMVTGSVAEGSVEVALNQPGDSGAGALKGVTLDAWGRVIGTTDATITGTAGRVTVTNGDATAGVPTIDLAPVANTGGGSLLKIVRDAWGRITGTSTPTTTDLAEGSNLYFAAARVLATVLTGLSTAANAVIAATDTVLSALGKLQAQITANLAALTGHTSNTSNPHGVTKAQVGLGNVDNTSDADKPVSAAQAAALALKQDISGLGTAAFANTGNNAAGVVPLLDSTGAGQTSLTVTGASARANLYLQSSNIDASNIAEGTLSFAGTGSVSSSVEKRLGIFVVNTDGGTAGNRGGRFMVSLKQNGSTIIITRLSVGYLGHIEPGIDNAQTMGSSALRWSVVYAGTGTINTSDAREKTDVSPLTPAELAAAADLSRAIGTYQWLESVQAKGTDARHHAGLTVQQAIAIMQAHGLDPMRYGFICYDQWDELPEVVDPETDEVTQVYRPAGDRYSFRHDELLLFIARGFAARLDALESA